MKIIAENPAEEALLWRIKALSDELVNQDNRSTSMPMWTILDNNKAGKDYGAVMYFTGKAAEQHINENPIPFAMYEIDAGRSEVTFVSNIHKNPELVEEK